MNLVLIGFRGTGKTTVGKLLSQLTGMKFIDTDELIEKKAGLSIQEIVSRAGWPAFRQMEKKIIKEIASGDQQIIAAGGGAVLDEENVQALKENSLIIWLKANLQVISARLASDAQTSSQRPTLTGKGTLAEIEEVLSHREKIYAQIAALEIDTSNLNAEMVAKKILKSL